jgi:hypothetical protein
MNLVFKRTDARVGLFHWYRKKEQAGTRQSKKLQNCVLNYTRAVRVASPFAPSAIQADPLFLIKAIKDGMDDKMDELASDFNDEQSFANCVRKLQIFF